MNKWKSKQTKQNKSLDEELKKNQNIDYFYMDICAS